MISTSTSATVRRGARGRGGARGGRRLFEPWDVNYFAGGGGVSLGFERATGKCFDLAVNHDRSAIEMHAVNHPGTRHLEADVFDVDIQDETSGHGVRLFWASPDCRHFSRAKGSKPVEKKIRGLAWVIVKVARKKKPAVIILENVREFVDWGPLVPKVDQVGAPVLVFVKKKPPEDGIWVPAMVPCQRRKGLTFRRFTRALERLGYRVEWKVLDAADYGAPTHRKRLFLIARRDGRVIVWPERTHGPEVRTRRPWRTAAECIDWQLPCPSIFERARPLAEKTCRRIAMGIVRYVLTNPRPFIVPINHGDGRGGDRARSIDRPAPTQTSRTNEYLCAPTLAQVGYGEREGQAPRALDLQEPLGTVVGGGGKHALVAAMLARHCQNGSSGKCVWPADEPLSTVVSKAEHSTVGVVLKHYGGMVGHPPDRTLGTITARDHHSAMTACLIRQNHGEKQWNGADEPAPTVTTQDNKLGLVAAHLTQFRGSNKGTGGDLEAPLPSTTAQGGHAGMVYAFLMKYYGTGGQWQDLCKPLHTQTGRHRFGLVTVTTHGPEGSASTEPAVAVEIPGRGTFILADIGLRMLSPRELARCQGFPDDYVLTGSKSNQVAKIGNSVPPQVVEALVRANVESAA